MLDLFVCPIDSMVTTSKTAGLENTPVGHCNCIVKDT